MRKLSEREKEILAMEFSSLQIKSALDCQKRLEDYNEKLMAGEDVERPGLTIDEKKNMDLYFAQKTKKDIMRLKKSNQW